MRALKAVTYFINWLVCLVLGLFLLEVVGKWLFTGEMIFSTTRRGILVIFGTGLILAFLNAALAWDAVARAFGARYLTLQGEGGRVNVSVKALEGTLERAVCGLDEVASCRVNVEPSRKKGRPVVVSAHVALRGSVVYHSISRGIVREIESTFADIVSEEIPVECHVYWEKIKPRSASGPASQPSGYPRPRFPVEGEEESQ